MTAPGRVIAIHGAPRSGTSWLGQIFNSSPQVAYRFQPLFSYAFKSRIGPDSTRAEILAFFSDIHASRDDFLLQTDKLDSGAYPRFRKHENQDVLVYKEVRYHHILKNLLTLVPEVRVIGLVRHPCAVLNSWLRAPREFLPEWDVEREWRMAPSKNQGRPEEFYGFEKWMEVAQLFLELAQAYPDRFLLVRYVDLLRDTRRAVERLFSFTGLEISEQTLNFLDASGRADHPDTYAVFRRKGRDIAWKEELPTSIQNAVVDELRETPLAMFLEV